MSFPASAPWPTDQQRLFDELAQLHAAHARIEARLDTLLDGQQGLGVSEVDLCTGVRGLSKVSCIAERADVESDSLACPAASERIDRSKRSPTDQSEKAISEEDQGVESMYISQFVASTLPLGWPRSLKLRAEADDMKEFRRSTASVSASNAINCPTTAFGEPEIALVSRRCVLDPNSRFHTIWSIGGISLLAWDLFSLPFILAWDIQPTGWLYALSFMIPTFWSADLVLNLFTGVYSGAGLNTNLKAARRAYICSWFVLDLVVVLCDWIAIAVSQLSAGGVDSIGSFRMVRLVKLVRLLRILGVLRVSIFLRALENSSWMPQTDGMRLVVQLSQLLMGIVWVAHVLACAWFSLGRYGPSDTGMGWTQAMEVSVDGRRVPVLETPVSHQYMVALNWAAGQIAMGAFDAVPLNSMERCFFICVMMSAFLFGSTLVSSLSAAMIDYQMMKKDKTLRLRTLRRYLRENDVSARLSIPVTKQVEQRITRREPLDEKDVTALDLLSSTLRSHLRYEIQRPYLSRHPIFRLWESLDVALVHSMCMKAVSVVHVRPKDQLFVPGNAASAAHALVDGSFVYMQYPGSSPVQSKQVEEVTADTWICEAALWIQWTHVGSCEAITHCKLLEVSADELMQGLQRNLLVRDIGVEYGSQFHKRVTSAGPPHSAYPTDLHVPFTDYCDLVASMSPEIQVAIGNAAVRRISGPGRVSKAIENLKSEVESSKSILVVDGSGALVRLVSLVVLRLTDEKGNVLTQVGKWSGSEMQSSCQLPGLKQERGELVGDTINRIIEVKLPALQGQLVYAGMAQDNNETMSKDFGVHTRYLRVVCSASMKDGPALDAIACQPRINRISPWSSSIFHSESSSKLNAAQKQAWESLCTVDVYAIPQASGDPNLYAWLSPEMSSMLRTSTGEWALQKWISLLAFDQPMLDEDDELSL